jgi:hypothetical protein
MQRGEIRDSLFATDCKHRHCERGTDSENLWNKPVNVC